MDHSSGSHHSDMCSEVAVSFYYSARLTGHRGCLGEFAFFQLLTHTSGQEHFLFRLVNHEIFDCFFVSGICGSTLHFGSIFGFFVIFGREWDLLMFRGFLLFFGRTLGFLFWHDNHILRNPCNRHCKLTTTSHLIVDIPMTLEHHIFGFQLPRKFKHQEVVSQIWCSSDLLSWRDVGVFLSTRRMLLNELKISLLLVHNSGYLKSDVADAKFAVTPTPVSVLHSVHVAMSFGLVKCQFRDHLYHF